MSSAPCVIGECHVVCNETRNFVPPLYMFPELQPFALHHDSDVDLRSVTASIDVAKSSWTVVELQHPANAAQAATSAPPPAAAATIRAKLEALAKDGKLDFGRVIEGRPPGWLPTSMDLVTTLETLVDSVPGWRQDPDAVTAVISPYFLHLLAYQRLNQLVDSTRAADRGRGPVTPEEDNDVKPPNKRHRSEFDHGAPSVDAWDPTRNPSSSPSVATPELGPLPELAATLKKVAGRVWRQTASFGCQTDVRLPGTQWSVPNASLREVVHCPTVSIRGTKSQEQAPLQATLTIASDEPRRTVPIPSTHALYLGRGVSDEWHVDIGGGSTVSRAHFAIVPKHSSEGEWQYWLIPGGRNGCSVNQRWYHASPVLLNDGDHLRIGGAEIHVSVPAPTS